MKVSNVFLENELGVNNRWNDEVVDTEVRGPLSDANEIINWLKMNQPCDESEIDNLIRIIIGFEMDDDVSIGDYGIREVYGERMIFGPRNNLFIQGEELIKYLLDLLVGLKDELGMIEQN